MNLQFQRLINHRSFFFITKIIKISISLQKILPEVELGQLLEPSQDQPERFVQALDLPHLVEPKTKPE